MRIQSVAVESGLKLSYREAGDGETLVQIHGLGTGHRNYDLLTPVLSDHFHVIDIDLPGYGESDEREDDRTIHAFAEDVTQFIQALDLGPTHVHGTSMGGLIAMVMAGSRPDLVKRLVVTCSFARLDKASQVMHETWRSAARYGGSEALAELTSQQGFSRAFWDRPDSGATKAAFVAAIETATAERFLRDLDSMHGLDISSELHSITAPTLLLGADEDIITPVAAAPSGLGMTALDELIPDSTLDVMSGCGHFISIEHGGPLADRIMDFLNRETG